MDAMTVLSRDLMERTQKINTTGEAVALLLGYEHFRTLGDVLRRFVPDPDIKKRLAAGLQLWFPEDKPDSIDRKVRNWLNGKTLSVSKRDAYIICRILNLSLEQSDEFLGYAAGECIHWREPEDIVWCYSILHNLSPAQTGMLMERAKTAVSPEGIAAGQVSDSYTAEIHEKLDSVLYLDENALLDFLKEEKNRLGNFHNTAYRLFTQYMDLLKKGYSDEGVEALFKEMTQKEKKKALIPADGDIGPHKAERITVRDILETYLYRKLIPVQSRGSAKAADAFSPIQRSIRQNWPDEFSLSKMEARKQDVTRKALILLFLATDGTDSDYSDDYEDYEDFEDFESPDDAFQSIYTRLNMMLAGCGFPQLDPRNPFDWIIFFAISSGDLWESDARLQELLGRLYDSIPTV